MAQQQFQLKALITAIDKLSPALNQIKRNISSFRRSIKSFGDGAVPMAVGLGAAVGLTSKAFADFEDAGVRLKGAMMGMTGAVAPEFAKINDLAMELGNRLPGNTADFQNMMTALVQQGIAPQEILSGLGQAAAYLGVQLKLAPEQAAEFAAKMRTATGTTAQDMMALMDVIQRTANLGVRSDDMLQGFSKLTPALDMMRIKGLAAGQAMAPLLAMAIRTGMQGESAGNAYRKMFTAFFDAKKLASVNKVLSGKGVALDFTNGKGEFGGVEKMFTQLQKLRDLTTAERVPILKKLFGDDAETLQIVQLMISNGMAGYDAMKQKLEAQASLQMRVEQQLGTLKSLFDAAIGNAQNLMASIGEAFSPQIKMLVERLGALSAWGQEFSRNNPELIRAILYIATGFVAIKLAALGVAGALAVMTAVMGMSIIGLAIRGLVLGAGLVIAYWEPISGFFKNLWDGITSFFVDGWKGIKYILSEMMAFIEPLLSGMRWIGQKAGGLLGGGASQASSTQAASPSLPSMTSRGQRLNGAIAVRFDNAPQGMRVSNSGTNQSGVALNPDVGYSSFALGTP